MSISSDCGPIVLLRSNDTTTSSCFANSVGMESFHSPCRRNFYDPPAIVKTILSILFKKNSCMISILGLNTNGEFKYILECSSIKYGEKRPHLDIVLQTIVDLIKAQSIEESHFLQVFISFSPKAVSTITKKIVVSDTCKIFTYEMTESEILFSEKFSTFFSIMGIPIEIKAFVEMKLITLLLVNDNLHNYTIKSQILHTIISYDIERDEFDCIELIFHPRVACLIHKSIRLVYETGEIYILGTLHRNPIISTVFYKNLFMSKFTAPTDDNINDELRENDMGITILCDHPYIVEVAKFSCIQSFNHPKNFLYPVHLFVVDSGKYLTSDKIDEYGIDSNAVQKFLRAYDSLLKNVDKNFCVPTYSEVKSMFEVIERIVRTE